MRNSTEIQVWMLRNEYTVESIRKELGYTNHTSVSLTIAGRRHSQKVLDYLLEKGCPAKHLGLPKRMERAKLKVDRQPERC